MGVVKTFVREKWIIAPGASDTNLAFKGLVLQNRPLIVVFINYWYNLLLRTDIDI